MAERSHIGSRLRMKTIGSPFQREDTTRIGSAAAHQSLEIVVALCIDPVVACRVLNSLHCTALVCLAAIGLLSPGTGAAATYTVVPTQGFLSDRAGSLTQSVLFEPVYSQSPVDSEDTLAFQVALGPQNPSFLNTIIASVSVAATGASYAPVPNSVSPVSSGANNSAGWGFSGFDNSALQTSVLIAHYEPGALATIPGASRQVQIEVRTSAFLADPQVFSVAFVPVPEPSLGVGASLALAGLFGARRRRP